MLKCIVALLLLTGRRKRKFLEANAADIDLYPKAWLIPTSKRGKPGRVPLPNDAIAVMKQVPRFVPVRRPEPA